MKTLRLILMLFLCLVLVLLAIGFFLPGKIKVERSILMSASSENVFEQVNKIKQWKKWSPLMQSDTSMELSFAGPEKGIGATVNWRSKNKNIGVGKVSIISCTPFDSISVITDVNNNGNTFITFLFEEMDQKTKVTCRLETDLGINPVSRWIGLFTDRMIAPDLELGLMNLEKLTIPNRTVNGFEIIDYEVPARVLLSIRDTATAEMMEKKLAFMFDKISRVIKSNSLSPTGAPITIYHYFKLNIYDFETCIPIQSPIHTPEGINCAEVQSQKTVMLKYSGTRRLIGNAYSALQIYLTNNGLSANGPSWEEYINNPVLESDSNTRQTNIYFPVK